MISALLIIATLTFAQTQAAPSDDLEETVHRLVRQLNARQLSQRDEAEEELLGLGPAALDFLPSADSRLPAEAVQRMARVRRTLERRRAESIAAGSTVTHAKASRPVSQWLAMLAEQTGNKIIDFRDEFGQEAKDPEIELDLDKTPFWVALDQLLDKAQLDVYPFAGEPGIALVNRSGDRTNRSETASYAGAFRLEPLEMLARRDLRNPDTHTLRLRLQVTWEPKLRPIAIRHSLADFTAFDPDGQPLSTSGDDVTREIMIRPDSIGTELEVQLEPPSREVDRIARLEGMFQVLLPGGMETFRFENLATARGVEQRRAGVTVTLDQVRKIDFGWEMRLRVRFGEAAGALESHRGWVFNNPVFLETPKGERRSHDGLETTRQTENEVGIAYFFESDGDLAGHALVYETPAVILDVPVEFEIRDLMLP